MAFHFPFHKRYFQAKSQGISALPEPTAKAEKIADEIMRLFETYGAEDYDGEPVSQTSHMVQCAMLAMEHMSDAPLILGALLHDVGHLLKHEQPTETMDNFGVVNHEGLGADYLRSRYFSERVCAVVEQHVAAKRYLVAADNTYAANLSPASVQTLHWQGGPMTTDEAAAFEKHPYFANIINVRRWDEQAKNRDAALLPVSWFRKLIYEHLNNNLSHE